jgi:hypothetical protein
MANNLAQFYGKFTSGSDRFTVTTGRFFTIIFSFPDNALDFTKISSSNIAGKATSITNSALGLADNLGIGSGLLGTGLALLSKEIGLKENNMLRFPTEDIHWLIKGINLPNMKIAEGETILNSGAQDFGTYVIPGMGVVEPESNNFSIDLIPTVESPIENFFMPWMEEVMSMRNNSNVPFRRANIFVHVYNENLFSTRSKLGGVGDALNTAGELFNEINVKYTYKLSGAYPNFCDTPNLSHEGSMDQRTVGFSFNKIEYFGNPLVTGALNALKGVGNIPGLGISGADAVAGGRGLVDKVKRFAPGGSLNF